MRIAKQTKGVGIGALALVLLVMTSGEPAVAESPTGTVEYTAEQCPRDPVEENFNYHNGNGTGQPVNGPFVGYGCWLPAYNAASKRDNQTRRTTLAPALWAVDAAFSAAAGEQQDTDPVTFAMGLAGEVYEQADTLLNLLGVYHQAHVLDTTTSVETTVTGPTGTVAAPGVTVTTCSTLDCVSALPSSLPDPIGCPTCTGWITSTPLVVHPGVGTQSGGGGSGGGGGAGDSISRFEWRNNVILTNDPKQRTGGPGKVSGRASYNYYVQSEKFSPEWNFSATSQLYSAQPINGCRMTHVQSVIEPGESTQLVDWNPGSVDHYGSAGSVSISATLSGEAKTERYGGGGSLSIGRSWNTPQGIAGGQVTDNGTHHVLWKAPSKKSTGDGKQATGVETWKVPTGTMAGFAVGAVTTVNGC